MQRESTVNSPHLIHNGILCDASEALIAVTDGAIRWGQGVFETLAAYHGRPFLTESHLERLRHSAALLELSCPPDAILSDAMDSVLRSSGLDVAKRSRLRITLTSPPVMQSTANPGLTESWFIEASPLPVYPARTAVITVPFVRNDRSALAGLKTINYGENVIAQQFAREAGADEALFANTRDLLCEGTWSNIFVFHAGSYLTPPLSSGCLPGVTRAIVLELCRELGIMVRETNLPMNELTEAEGGFLTSSLREIQPIATLNGRAVNDPPGLAQIQGAYQARVEKSCHARTT